jgi:heat shock protein HspQ
MSGDQIRKSIIDFVGIDILEITVFPSYEKYWYDIPPVRKQLNNPFYLIAN